MLPHVLCRKIPTQPVYLLTVNQLLEWLKSGNLTSDGEANEVVRLVEADLGLLDDLIAGLSVDDDVIRGHTADALEKLARSQAVSMKKFIPVFLKSAEEDDVPMVRWHMAMVLGHLSIFQDKVDEITDALFNLLSDPSVFTRSWAIVSLCILARLYPENAGQIIRAIAPLETSSSAAIRSKVKNAIPILINEQTPFPKGWVKSKQLRLLISSGL